MSATQYATIQHSLPFVMQPPPEELTFATADTAVAQIEEKNYYTTTISTGTTSNWKPI